MDNRFDEQSFLKNEVSLINQKEYSPNELFKLARELLTQDQIREVIAYLRNRLST